MWGRREGKERNKGELLTLTLCVGLGNVKGCGLEVWVGCGKSVLFWPR